MNPDYITEAVDNRLIVDLLFFDYSKAFDRVSHPILLRKLVDIGITDPLLSWIECFLRERTMQVRISGKLSSSVAVSSGVPQGSVLGPILFLVYVNYVAASLTCEYKLFADDIKIYVCFSREDNYNGEQRVQSNINALVHSGKAWGLEMNVSKCVCMRFTPRNSPLCYSGRSPYKIDHATIDFVQSYSDLGVTVDRTLKFHSHIKRVVNIANALTNNILGSTLCRDKEFILNVYLYHVRPQLEYGSALWCTGYRGDLKLLERVQRRWTKSVVGLEDLPYNARLESLNLFSLAGRILRNDMITIWKILNKKNCY